MTLLETALYCLENSKSNNLFVLLVDDYQKGTNANVEKLFQKGLLVKADNNSYWITSELEDFINNGGLTAEDLKEKIILDLTKEANDITKKSLEASERANITSGEANKKSKIANIISFGSLTVSVVVFIFSLYLSSKK